MQQPASTASSESASPPKAAAASSAAAAPKVQPAAGAGGIFAQVSEQIKVAMKAKDAPRLEALRGIRAAFLQGTKVEGAGDTLTDEQCQALLRKLAKQRAESIEAFDAAGRRDMADKERFELGVIEAYLPALADEATTRRWVEEAIAASGATSPSQLG